VIGITSECDGGTVRMKIGTASERGVCTSLVTLEGDGSDCHSEHFARVGKLGHQQTDSVETQELRFDMAPYSERKASMGSR